MPHPQQVGRRIVRVWRDRADAGEFALVEGCKHGKSVVVAGIAPGEPFLAQPLDEAEALRACFASQRLEIVRQAFRQPDDLDAGLAHRPSNSALEM